MGSGQMDSSCRVGQDSLIEVADLPLGVHQIGGRSSLGLITRLP